MTPALRFDRLRHPRVLIAVVASSALVLGAAVTGIALTADANARAGLGTRIERVSTSITSTIESGRAVVAAHLAAAVCVAESSARLAPVTGAGTRFTTASFDRASTVVQRASTAPPVPAYDPAPPAHVPADAGVAELESALAELSRAEAAAETEVAALASKARAAEQDCATARTAESALLEEIARRSGELVAANPKAAADSVSALNVARDAVAVAEAGALERWIAAAAAVEASHAAAVAAEAQAAQAAQAARQAAAGRDTSSPRVTFDNPPAPEPPYRKLTPEEVAALGMPPGSQMWEVPAGEIDLPPLPPG